MRAVHQGNSRCPPSKVAFPTKSCGGREYSVGTYGSFSSGALSKGESVGWQNSNRNRYPVANKITYSCQLYNYIVQVQLEDLTSTSSKISSEVVMILPVADSREGALTVRIGATFLICSAHLFSCSVS